MKETTMTRSQPYRYVRQPVFMTLNGSLVWGWKYSEDKAGTCKRFDVTYIHTHERTQQFGFHYYVKTKEDARRVLARWRGQRATEKRRLAREYALLEADGTIVENLAPSTPETRSSHLEPSTTI